MFGKVSRKEFKEHRIQHMKNADSLGKTIAALKLKIMNLENILVSKGILNRKALDLLNKDLNETLR